MANWSTNKVGEAGIYFAAMKATVADLGVVLTSRNREGADMLIYTADNKALTVQVKSFTNGKRSKGTSFGASADRPQPREPFWIFVWGVDDDPVCYVLTSEEVRQCLNQNPGVRSGKPPEERLWWFDVWRLCRPGSPDELIAAKNAWHKFGDGVI